MPCTNELLEQLYSTARQLAEQKLTGDTVIMHPDLYRRLASELQAELEQRRVTGLINGYDVQVSPNGEVDIFVKPSFSLRFLNLRVRLDQNTASQSEGREGKDRFEILILE